MDTGASSTIPPSPGSLPPPALTTVMASEMEVSNGFVKNGASLPYVIDTNKSGNRKKNSKLVPVCGVCGKKFVCVTTMKRHLVTHTGERPFNCKVCGKQYTQKGNLRVHERTHRNERPFECNICHQKFYRKEPMQKHQWRQHGIGHYKSRPNGPEGTAIGIIGAESILFNSMASTTPDDQAPPGILFENHPNNSQEVSNFSEEEEEEENEAHFISGAVSKYITDTRDTEEEEIDNKIHHEDPRKSLEMLKFSQDRTMPTPEDESCGQEKPMKLKMKFAQAYLKEVKEVREREERDGRCQEGRDCFEVQGSIENIEENLGEIQLSQDITISEVPFETVTVTTTASPDLTAPTLEKKECVECVCKACGSKCKVTDPYNFSCPVCNVKYTSLPTHMIADPLQCIGCLKLFEHKPAMKEHQSNPNPNDKDRPFSCCKCGHPFKQKAHLQKHQWRIHRRTLQPDPNVKEAEAILKAVNEMSSIPVAPAPVEEMTIQQIIDRGIGAEVRKEPMRVGSLESFEVTKPLDLSPCKMYGTANSITAWVKQVETARTPPVPDISIHRRPVVLPTKPLHPGQLATDDPVSVTIQLLGPAKLPPLAPPTAPPSLPKSFSSAQPIAVKSRPPIFGVKDPVFQKAWRTPILEPREDNALLNQRNFMEDLVLPSEPLQQSEINLDSIERVFKKPRKDFDALYTTSQSQPADLSIHQKLDFSPPSPPLALNLSKMEDVPYDYSTISRSELITRRLRNKDERSGF